MTIRNAVPGDIIARTPEEETELRCALSRQQWLDNGGEVHVQLMASMLRAIAGVPEYRLYLLDELRRRVAGGTDPYGILGCNLHAFDLDGLWNAGKFLPQATTPSGRPQRFVELRLWRHDCEPMHDSDGKLLPLTRR